MFRNYVKIAFRSLQKNYAYVLINTIGLGTALACGIIAYLNFSFADNWDHQNQHLNEIYRIRSIRNVQGSLEPYGIIPNQISNLIESNSDEEIVEVNMNREYMSAKIGPDVFNSNIIYTDNNFFKVFDASLIEGDLTSLDQNSNMVITATAAKKFFGDKPAVGQVVEQVFDDQIRSYSVAAVIEDFPMNSSFANFETLVSMNNYRYVVPDFLSRPWNYWNTTFLYIKDPAIVNRLSRMLSQFIQAQNKARPDFIIDHFELEKLDGMAAAARDERINAHWWTEAMPKSAVIGPSVMAILLLLLACFNYTNISIAMSGRRLKEIGLRKVMGSARKQLIFQFIVENMIMTFFALLVGIFIAELLLPLYNGMWDFVELSLSFSDNWPFLGFLVILLIFVGLLAGSYPAFYISSFEATPILRGTFKFGGNTRLSKSLLVLQLSISLIALVGTFAFFSNAKYQRNLDMGFNTENILYTFVNSGKEYDQLKASLDRYPVIEKISGSKNMFMYGTGSQKITYNGQDYISAKYDVGYDYFDIMGSKIVSGEGFEEESENDREGSVIVNEAFVNYFGIGDGAIGKEVMLSDTIPTFIKGVVKDSYLWGFWRPIEPAIFQLIPKSEYRNLIVKAPSDKLKAVNEIMGKEWKILFPNRLYNSVFMSNDMEQVQEIGINIVYLFGFLGMVALLLSIAGLYAMISLNIIKRKKEIGVRKVLGASVLSIIKNLNAPYFIILAVAIVLGCSAAFYFTGSLMDMIWVYHSSVSIYSLLFGSSVLVFATGLMLTGKVLYAALADPVSALRSE